MKCPYPHIKCPNREREERSPVEKDNCLLKNPWACPLDAVGVPKTKLAEKLAQQK